MRLWASPNTFLLCGISLLKISTPAHPHTSKKKTARVRQVVGRVRFIGEVWHGLRKNGNLKEYPYIRRSPVRSKPP
jgi:hypothetical protein